MLNKIFLETDGLVVGGTQLTTTGGNVNIANSVYVGANTVTGNLTVTGSFNYTKGNANIPVFRAWGDTFLTNNGNPPGQVPYNRVQIDTNNCYNPTNQWLYLNGIYTPPWSWAPNVAGYYMINATFGATGGATTFNMGISILKQNETVAQNFVSWAGINTNAHISTIVYMNGVSDYVSVYGVQSSGSPVSIGSSSQAHTFNGCLIRTA